MSELCKHLKKATQFDRTAEANQSTIQIFSPKYESNFAKYWVEKKFSGRGRDFWQRRTLLKARATNKLAKWL